VLTAKKIAIGNGLPCKFVYAVRVKDVERLRTDVSRIDSISADVVADSPTVLRFFVKRAAPP
jgi:hypothetical protein